MLLELRRFRGAMMSTAELSTIHGYQYRPLTHRGSSTKAHRNARSRTRPPATMESGCRHATATCTPQRLVHRHVLSPRCCSNRSRAQACQWFRLANIPTGSRPESGLSIHRPSVSLEKQRPPHTSHGPRKSRLNEFRSPPSTRVR